MKLLLVTLIALLVLAGCSTGAKPTPEPATAPSRFTTQMFHTPGGDPNLWVITDTVTGCQYLEGQAGYSGGVVLMPNTCKAQ